MRFQVRPKTSDFFIYTKIIISSALGQGEIVTVMVDAYFLAFLTWIATHSSVMCLSHRFICLFPKMFVCVWFSIF